MCLMCDDEASYKAYMDYLDAVARRAGEGAANPDEAIDKLLDRLEADDRAKAQAAARPENDKTLSPFFCSPVNPSKVG
jgi:hypothetical protein